MGFWKQIAIAEDEAQERCEICDLPIDPELGCLTCQERICGDDE
jgi:hypothetical protein